MKLMPLNKLGARQKSTDLVDFGVYLPWVSAEHGNDPIVSARALSCSRWPCRVGMHRYV